MAGRRRAPTACAMTAIGLLLLTSCSMFGDDDASRTVSVFDARPGDCFLAPAEITIELTELRAVDCTDPHEQEAYAVVPFTQPGGRTVDGYPGEAALKDFADGVCIERFAEYVGVDFRDSELFYTYLLPSARGWEHGKDRSVTCFITTTGGQMTSSVRGTAA